MGERWRMWKESWLNDPAFSFRVFVLGILPFALGALPLWLWPAMPVWARNLCWGLIGLGLLIALPGYIGIWRWRWKTFRER
jgi:hypothetical protein